MPGSLLAHSAGGQSPAGYLPSPLLARAGSFSQGPGARLSRGRVTRVSLAAVWSPTPHLTLVTDPLLIAWLGGSLQIFGIRLTTVSLEAPILGLCRKGSACSWGFRAPSILAQVC